MATKGSKASGVDEKLEEAPTPETLEALDDDQFREQQRQQAAEQNQLAPNAVPEQRPIASQQVLDYHQSSVYKRQRDEGTDLAEPMPKSAFETAASEEQLEKSAQEEQKMGVDTLREGDTVEITNGDYEGARGVITEVSFADFDESQKAHSGDPAAARFARANSYLVRTRGGRHALLSVSPEDLKVIPRTAVGINASEA
jgi:hypothetical protein